MLVRAFELWPWDRLAFDGMKKYSDFGIVLGQAAPSIFVGLKVVQSRSGALRTSPSQRD